MRRGKKMSEKVENDGREAMSSLVRHKLVVAYDGTRYQGFQRQASDDSGFEELRNSKKRRWTESGKPLLVPLTVQGCLERAIIQYTSLNRSELRPVFAGRTDAGVHARGQVLVVSLPEDLGELWLIRKSINSRLPEDISIQDVSVCENQSFDPRKHATLKRYTYTVKYRRVVVSDGKPLPICTSGPNTLRDAWDRNNVWICPWALDDSNLQSLCQRMTGEHDYSAFVHKKARKDKSNILTVEKFTVKVLNETNEDAPVVNIMFIVEAKGFRRSMVRNLVGLVVDICRGAVDVSILDEVWTGTDTVARKVNSAPACGLCLEHVWF